MSNLFWLTEARTARLHPCHPKSHGKPHVHGRRMLSDNVFNSRDGMRWPVAPRDDGPKNRLYNRRARWSQLGVFARIIAAPAAMGADATKCRTVMIDASRLKAHSMASSLRICPGEQKTSSRNLGARAGFTPSRIQSGERDVSGGVTKAATVIMHRGRSP